MKILLCFGLVAFATSVPAGSPEPEKVWSSEGLARLPSAVDVRINKIRPAKKARVVAQIEATLEAAGKEVETTIMRWAESWSARDIEAYLEHYSNEFKPSKGTRAAWEKQRRRRFNRKGPVRVSVSDMQILTKRKKALANFTQAYRSDIYADEVRKTLILVATDLGWKILYELVEN